ncbi:protein of unknown function [Burkholderia multivorans]
MSRPAHAKAAADQAWSLDFFVDQLSSGQRSRALRLAVRAAPFYLALHILHVLRLGICELAGGPVGLPSQGRDCLQLVR